MSMVENQRSPVEEGNALLKGWLERLEELVRQVETWAKELDWSTRRIEKKMEDSKVGPYKAPALMFQRDTVRILLEPIARAAPGADGVVDLYLMPAYDDIASLYFYDNGWQLHYPFCSSPSSATSPESDHKPFSLDSFKDVLDEMIKNAS
jgi:hypothetical protein